MIKFATVEIKGRHVTGNGSVFAFWLFVSCNIRASLIVDSSVCLTLLCGLRDVYGFNLLPPLIKLLKCESSRLKNLFLQ